MSALNLNSYRLPFARLPHFGAEHILARLSTETALAMGFPLFTEDRVAHTSASEFSDFAACGPLIDAYNPGCPPVPPTARFVMAGQQPGLLTGPLYTFLKALSAILLAKRLERHSDTPVLPLFWIASEDHDVLEVNRFYVDDQRFVFPYPHEIRRGRVPQVGEIPIEAAREPLLAFLSENLQKTEFSQWVRDRVAAADFSNYATVFHDLMRALFKRTELRFIDPLALRRLTAPVLARLIERWRDVTDAFERGTRAVRDAGFSAPLDHPGAFEIVDGNRVPLDFDEESVSLSRGEMSLEEAACEVRSRPESFSTGAALRPVVQDAVLPVIAFVAGPTELLYLWQIRPICEIAHIRPSLLVPRITATFLPAKIVKAVQKANVPLEQLFEAASRPTDWLAERNRDPVVDRIHGRAEALIDEIDRVLAAKPIKWLQRSRSNLSKETWKIVRRMREDAVEADSADLHRLEKIAETLLPGGKPQERVMNPFQLLNQYGPAFVDAALENLDPMAFEHQIVTIGIDAIECVDPASESADDGRGNVQNPKE